MLLAILSHIRIVRWFNPVFGNSFTFAGLVAGIEVIGAFRLFAGQLFVRISVVIVSHRVLHRTQGNSGALSGGAIFAEHTQLALSRVTVSASKGGAFGGGIYSLLGKTTIEHSRLVGNQSGLYGGGLHSASDLSVRVYFSTISGNTAGAHGAGLFIQGTGAALIGGSTISGEKRAAVSASLNPAFRSALHCMGVRTPLRSPR